MNWYNFIFSEKKSYKIRRHIIFWLLWWLYFSASYFHYEQTGLRQIEFEPWNLPFLIKSILLLSIHVGSCYYFIGILMPRYLLKRRYGSFALRILGLGMVILFSSYVLHKSVFPMLHTAFGYKPKLAIQNIWWTSIAAGLLSAPKIISAAAVIKLVKRWWLKQQEKERLEREKLLTELQLLKAQIHPEFLFSSLNKIFQMTQEGNKRKAAMLLLNLADILSYMLYDCDNNLVPLEKEIKMIKDFLIIEKTRMGKRLEMDVAIKGEAAKKKIAPLLLFSFVENSFSFFPNKKTDRNWINVEFLVHFNVVTMKLIHGKGAEHSIEMVEKNTKAKAMRWLDFYYPNQYQLKTTVEPEMMMTCLSIQLDELPREKSTYYTEPHEQRLYATT